MESGGVGPLTFVFLLCFVSCKSFAFPFLALNQFVSFCKKSARILSVRHLHLQINLESVAIFIALSFLIYEHGTSLHLFSSLISFINILVFFIYILYIILLALYIHISFLDYIAFLISNSTCSLLLYRKANDFCILTLYLATLLFITY